MKRLVAKIVNPAPLELRSFFSQRTPEGGGKGEDLSGDRSEEYCI